MATMEAPRRLNPKAPEFFPYYQNPQLTSQLLLHRPCNLLLNPPIFPPPNPNPCIYYSTSLPSSPPFIHYPNSTCYPNTNQPLLFSPNPDLLVPAATELTSSVAVSHEWIQTQNQTQLVDEPQVEEGGVSPSGGKRGGYRNRRSNNGRERGYYENHNVKKQSIWRAKGSDDQGGDYKNNCKKPRQGCDNNYRRNERSNFGGSRLNHPVLRVQPDGQNTTVMIRNIPNRYTRQLLMQFLDDHCMRENEEAKKPHSSESTNDTIVSAFDFLYLPMDFEKKANKGYAFVNFTNSKAVWRFHLAVHNQGWSHFQSNKICDIAYARIQGKEELVRHFQSSAFECETDDYLPVSFSPPRNGSRAPVNQKIIGRWKSIA